MAIEQATDPRQWSILAEPSGIVYAQRPTREEAELVLVEQDHLIRLFGAPRIVPPTVTDLPPGILAPGGGRRAR